jgi:hypothetical protein
VSYVVSVSGDTDVEVREEEIVGGDVRCGGV